MRVEFDGAKDLANREKHGLSLAAAAEMDFAAAQIIPDLRRDYGEARYWAVGPIGEQLHVLAFTCAAKSCGPCRCARRTSGKGSAMSEHDDVPELAEEDFARARPFKEAFPEQYRAWRRRGRPPVAEPKVHVGFRLAADVVQGIKATGRGYNARVEKVLRAALAKGEL
jgi:uncharacterized DUF497 family protein/uncharacterized protein (DUF4415 family)